MKILLFFFSLAAAVPAGAGYTITLAAPAAQQAEKKTGPDADVMDMNRGLAICHKYTNTDDCLKIPFSTFAAKYRAQITDTELKLFRIGQIAELKVHLAYLRVLGEATENENRAAAAAACTEFYKQFEIAPSTAVCVGYIADMLWDLRMNNGRRIQERQVQQKVVDEDIKTTLSRIEELKEDAKTNAPNAGGQN